MTELAMPAGGLEEALVSLRAGADAVYFGLREFSARKGAVNFSLEDLRKIRRFARENGKKIYITINTLVDDSRLEEAFSLISKVDDYRPDGIIIQDLGLINMVRRCFPGLPLHASTQLAVHTVSGVKELQSLGFERVVLSRELTFEEIKHIRKACPDIELKVFIHGAMCCGFSGLCMASHVITGRSANEGACAQICRTWFRDSATGEKLYPFSLKDMEVGEEVRKLRDIGIDSLKVEGRLKGPEYCASVTRYYRDILDDRDVSFTNHRYTFSRARGDGFFRWKGPNHDNLVTGSYTGHLGEVLGKVIGQEGRRVTLNLIRDAEPRDGLMYLRENAQGLLEPVKFSCSLVGKNTILLPNFEKLPCGTEIYKISSSSMNEKKQSTDIPMDKKALSADIAVTKDSLTVKTAILTETYPIEVQESDKDRTLSEIRRIFAQSGDSSLQLEVKEIENGTGWDNFFIRSSALKEIRRNFLEKADSIPTGEKSYSRPIFEEARSFMLPERKLLSDEHEPWCIKGKSVNGITYITLPPVSYDEDKMYREAEDAIAAVSGPVMIGLNNIGHVLWAKQHPGRNYFADIYLYMSNREAALLLKEELGDSLKGGYLWLERDSFINPWPFRPTVVKDFTPPLFIARMCYRHDSLGLPCRGCGREHLYTIEQNGFRYSVHVKDCNTVMSRIEDEE